MIPASLSLVGITLVVLHILKTIWNIPNFFSAIVITIFACLILGPCSYGFFGEFLFNGKNRPNTLYIATKTARTTVPRASASVGSMRWAMSSVTGLLR